MKKNIILILVLFLLTKTSFAIEVGYVDMQKVVNNYPLAQKYKREINNKYEEVNNYIKKQEKEIIKIKNEQERELRRKELIISVEQKQKEYLSLRKRREDEINSKIKLVADKIRVEKRLDLVIKKDSTLSGGIDLTQFVINGLK